MYMNVYIFIYIYIYYVLIHDDNNDLTILLQNECCLLSYWLMGMNKILITYV